MPTLRELKIRIGSVASTEKITGAMKMISSAKVHQNEQQLKQLQPFRSKLTEIMGHILGAEEDFSSPLIESREVQKAAVIVYGSDDGLCGAYNINIFKGLLQKIDQLRREHPGASITVIPVGEKIAKPVNSLDNVTVEVPEGVNSKMPGETVTEFTKTMRDRFMAGEYDLVEVLYMKYKSRSRQTLTMDQLFPVSQDALTGDARADENQLYIFEPDPNSIFNEVLPMFVMSTMQEITIENRASEQAARVMAMQTANDNAQKLRDELQLEYNKLRQQGITAELLDLVGGQVDRS